jgi:hypothetical protein
MMVAFETVIEIMMYSNNNAKNLNKNAAGVPAA